MSPNPKGVRFHLPKHVEKAIQLLGGDKPGVAVLGGRIVRHVHLQLGKKYPLAQISDSVQATLGKLVNKGSVIQKGKDKYAQSSCATQPYTPENNLETRTTPRVRCVSSIRMNPNVKYRCHSDCSLSGNVGERALKILRPPPKSLKPYGVRVTLPGVHASISEISVHDDIVDVINDVFSEPDNMDKLDTPKTACDNEENIASSSASYGDKLPLLGASASKSKLKISVHDVSVNEKPSVSAESDSNDKLLDKIDAEKTSYHNEESLNISRTEEHVAGTEYLDDCRATPTLQDCATQTASSDADFHYQPLIPHVPEAQIFMHDKI